MLLVFFLNFIYAPCFFISFTLFLSSLLFITLVSDSLYFSCGSKECCLDITVLGCKTELPGLLALGDVAEALLCLPHGNELLCQLVANFPESFMEGECFCLICHPR